MGLSDNLKGMAGNAQQNARVAGFSLFQRLLRAVSGFFIGIVLALIVQEFIQNGNLILVFLTVLFSSIIYRLLRPLTVWQILVFNLIVGLAANTLRMYVMLAP
jgi:hypothetical protein